MTFDLQRLAPKDCYEGSQLIVWYLTVALLGCCIATTAAGADCLKVGSGTKGSPYYTFAEDLIALYNEAKGTTQCLAHVETNGTKDNLERIAAGTIDFGIVQNDIAHYVYYGRHDHPINTDFGAGLPLFSEYVQIVVRGDSNIRLLSDLNKKTIILGPRNSGSYWNAMDVLGHVGLRLNIDYRGRFDPAAHERELLRNRDVDAVIHTSALIRPDGVDASENSRLLTIPDEVVNLLLVQRPFYGRARLQSDSEGVTDYIQTLSVMAYLVVGNHVNDANASDVIAFTLDRFKALDELDRAYVLVSLQETLGKRPFPFHPGAVDALVREGYIKAATNQFYYFLIIVALLLLIVWAQRTNDRRDRLGQICASGKGVQYRLANAVSRFSVYLYIAVAFVILVFGLVALTQNVDAIYAREHNIESAFSELSLFDALIWMAIFLGSGHTGDTFPVSSLGQILASALPVVGVVTILGTLYAIAERAKAARSARYRGTLVKKVSDHVLICGWNDKVPALIKVLTSDEVPHKKQVVVVAELDSDQPLRHDELDSSYVSYCRGDSADHSVLERAHATAASAAIVVAGVKKQADRNLGSVLTVLALRQMHSADAAQDNCGFFIAVEMVHRDNERFFQTCGASEIVDSTVVADRILAQCCVNPEMFDFVMDVLTYDDFSEIYSVKASELQAARRVKLLAQSVKKCGVWHTASRLSSIESAEPLRPVGKSVRSVRRLMGDCGVNVIGVAVGEDIEHRVTLDYSFTNGAADYRLASDDYTIKEDDALIFLAGERTDIFFGAKAGDINDRRQSGDSTQLPVPEFRCKSVLLVGPADRCVGVASCLSKLSEISVTALTDTQPADHRDVGNWVVGNILDQQTWSKARVVEADCVLIFSSNRECNSVTAASKNQVGVDAQTIVTARLAHEMAKKGRDISIREPTIIAEIVDWKNKQLFKDAGVEYTVANSMLIERLLVKLMYNRGRICQFLVGLLALDDEVYLRSLTVREGDGYCGLRVDSLFEADSGPVTVVGYLPGDRRGLENCLPDFDNHFVTAKQAEFADQVVMPGAVLVMIVDDRHASQRNWNETISTPASLAPISP